MNGATYEKEKFFAPSGTQIPDLSHCSGRGWCLENIPLKREAYPQDLPGEEFDIDTQCRQQFGPRSRACKIKWCHFGECRNPDFEPRTVHGSWGQWGEWGVCSRTCGGGVAASERQCNDPV
nr:hypothetical protein BaRGS_008821 [Batillaria attramentaria]